MRKTVLIVAMLFLSNAVFSQNPPRPPERPYAPQQNYRGKRKNPEGKQIFITTLRTSLEHDGTFDIDLFFNEEIEPHSVTPRSFELDGRPLPPGTPVNFSRDGRTVRITVRAVPELSLRITGISSFNGITMEPVLIEHIQCGRSYRLLPPGTI